MFYQLFNLLYPASRLFVISRIKQHLKKDKQVEYVQMGTFFNEGKLYETDGPHESSFSKNGREIIFPII